MSQEHASINGALLRLRREARGWVQADVATRACMSVKQIKQLEEGGLSAFYSEAVKTTAAKKVGALLGLTSDEVFSNGQSEPTVATASSISPEADLAELLASTHAAPAEQDIPHAEPQPIAEAEIEPQPVTQQAPAFHLNTPAEVEVVEPPAYVSSPTQSVTSVQEAGPAKSKTSWGLVLVLFVGAIVLAALFRPESEPVATEPPPPLAPALQSEPPAEVGKDGVAAPSSDQPANGSPVAASAATAASTSGAPAVAPVAPAVNATATPTTPAGTTPVVAPTAPGVPASVPAPVSPAVPKNN